MERFRKIYVDSRLRYTGSGSDFSAEIPDTLELGSNQSMYVSAVSFPNSWHTVDNNNDQLYLMQINATFVNNFVVVVPGGLYNHSELAAAIQASMSQINGWTVVAHGETLTFDTGDPDDILRVPSHHELTDPNWKASFWDAADSAVGYSPAATNDLNFMLSPEIQAPGYRQRFMTPIIDLTPHTVLYLHSNLGSYGAIDVAGRKTIVASILIDKTYGNIIHLDHHGLAADSVDVSHQRFKNMRFSLKNCFGQTVDLRGGQMVIELCFGPTV